jgi:hypothetical protein
LQVSKLSFAIFSRGNFKKPRKMLVPQVHGQKAHCANFISVPKRPKCAPFRAYFYIILILFGNFPVARAASFTIDFHALALMRLDLPCKFFCLRHPSSRHVARRRYSRHWNSQIKSFLLPAGHSAL